MDGQCSSYRMAYVVMACVVMAYVVMAYVVMAYVVMAYIVMAYVVMAYIVMAYVVMAYVVTPWMAKCSSYRTKTCSTAGHEVCQVGEGARQVLLYLRINEYAGHN